VSDKHDKHVRSAVRNSNQTSCCRVFSWTFSVTQLIKKLSAFKESRGSLTYYKSQQFDPILRQISTAHTFTHYLSMISLSRSILIPSSYLRLNQNCLCSTNLLHARYISWFSSHSNNIVTCLSDFRRGFGLANRFIGYSPVVNTINYITFKITVIITHK
jgi:hypothetical protein